MNVVGVDALDTPLDYESLAAAGTSLGCAGCIVMDDSGSIVRSTPKLAHFYRHESCGKCTLPRGHAVARAHPGADRRRPRAAWRTSS